jgi:hypothetical protein
VPARLLGLVREPCLLGFLGLVREPGLRGILREPRLLSLLSEA